MATKAYRLAHVEEIKVQAEAWRRTHPKYAKVYHLAHSEEIKTRRKAYRAAHPGISRMTAAAWYLSHKEYVKERHRIYRFLHPEHPEIACARRQRRRALKRSLPDTLIASEWHAVCAAYCFRCAYCGKKQKLTMDHIVPLSKGGGTTAFNIVPACLSCNSSKQAGPPPKPINLAMGI